MKNSRSILYYRPKTEDKPIEVKKGGRGLASASPETRKRVATMGGKASHGGGRKPRQQ